MSRPRVAILCGYFDWFSGYQETVLARALTQLADVEVIAGDQVSGIFSDNHLSALGQTRSYPIGIRQPENGIVVTRFSSRIFNATVWARGVRKYLRQEKFDLIIQVMPGQGLSAAAGFTRLASTRVALYGDNSGMWHMLPTWKRAIKWIGFSLTKGVVYQVVNASSTRVYGYTPETTRRLRWFQFGANVSVLPLAFDQSTFYRDSALRAKTRQELGYGLDDQVICTAGKFEEYKRIEWVIQATSELASRHPHAKLLIVGADDSTYAARLHELVQANESLSGRVIFLGFQSAERLNAIFNAADVGVWPRFPAITIQQAMGTGMSVVLPRNDWVGHLIRPGSGAYFDPQNAERGLVDSLDEILSSTSFDDTARNGRAQTNEWFAGPGIARELLGALA